MDRLRVSIHEARDIVLAQIAVLPTAVVPIEEATGCVLADAVVAEENVPPFANSAFDGYAVVASDIDGSDVELDVVDEVAAGAASAHHLVAGEAIRIMTGAPMPSGADAVVMVERTRRLDGGRVRISGSSAAGEAVRRAGDDIAVGATVFEAGAIIRPAVAGVLASVNARSLAVTPRARVAVLSTGDELVDDGGPLAPGQIRESNKTMLVGLIAEAGAIVVDFGVVRDDEAALEAVLREAADSCDAIITSGGVSMGDYDVVKAVLSRIAAMQWMEVAIKPAKPFAFGQLINNAGNPIPVFGLPGNPVSSLVSFELLARPGLLQMMGHRESLLRPTIRAIADSPLRRSQDGKIHYQRVHGRFAADGRYHITAGGAQGSHQLAASAVASALAELPDGSGVAPGDEVTVFVLSF
ncbi:MAG TPA: gephyrin-like molybdotransferase Glp [Ilumatobacteraceae bacterium]